MNDISQNPRGPTLTSARFELGETVITPSAEKILNAEDVQACLRRHANGDWGDCCPEDCKANELSLALDRRLISVFHDRNGVKFLIVTEGGCFATTVVLPDDD